MAGTIKRIFWEWDNKLPGGIGGVNERTIRRWFEEFQPANVSRRDGAAEEEGLPAEPSPAAASDVARDAWARTTGPQHDAKRRELIAVARRIAGDFPEQWAPDGNEFRAWFRRRAEEERQGRLNAEKPLEVTIDLLVAPPGETEASSFRPLLAGGVVPVTAGQRVQVKITVTREAFLYVLWVGVDGHIEPLYPWVGDKKPFRAPELQTPRATLTLPEGSSWKFSEETGLETVTVVARRTALGPRDLTALADGRGALPKAPDCAPGPFAQRFSASATNANDLKGIDRDPLPVVDRVKLRHDAVVKRLQDFVGDGVGAYLSFRNNGAAT